MNHILFRLCVRRRTRTGFALPFLPLVLGAWLLSVACANTPPPQHQPVTLKIGVAAPRAGGLAIGVPSFVGSYLTFESLVGIGWDGRAIPKMASSYEWLPNRLGLKLKLRRDLKFHDGTPLDVALAKTTLTQFLGNPANRLIAVGIDSVTDVEVEGDSLLIRLKRPEAFLLADLANSPITHPTDPETGIGPYKPVIGETTSRFEAFGDYYRGRPAIDYLEVQGFEEQRSAWAALMRGEIDAVHEITPGAIDFVEAQTTVKTFEFTRPYFFQLLFNTKHPTLGKKAVRQALSYGVDRQRIIDVALHTRGLVAEGPIWPFHWAYSKGQKTYGHNPEAARLLLETAGLSRHDRSSGGRMDRRFSFTCLTVAGDARYERIALLLQKQLYEIGIDIDIQALPAPELFQRIGKGDYDSLLIERTSGRSLAWTYLSFHSSVTPFGYTAADEVLDRLRAATADDEIRAGVSDLQQVLFEDPPAIFLAWPNVSRAVTTRFIVPDEPGRDIMGSLWQWRPAPAPK